MPILQRGLTGNLLLESSMDWFRFYNDALIDPKVQCLPGDQFKTWVNLLCLASKHAGLLPAVPHIAYCLRLSDEDAGTAVVALAQAGLFEQDEEGRWHPHNWIGRQKKSDLSTPRVQAHREAKRFGNGSETPTEREREKKKKKKQASSSSSLNGQIAPSEARSQAPPRSPPPGARAHHTQFTDAEIDQWLKDQQKT